MSDNRAEFGNDVLAEIYCQFVITQTFTAAYHPASNGLVEWANRKLLEVLRPIVNDLLENWEDWLPHVAASINSSINYSTGKSPHYTLFGVEKRLPYDLLTITQQPVYNIDKYSQQQICFLLNPLQCQRKFEGHKGRDGYKSTQEGNTGKY